MSLFDTFATGFTLCIDTQITAEAPAGHRAAGSASFDDVTWQNWEPAVPRPDLWSTLFLHGVCMLREFIYSECAHEQHVRKTLTLTHAITAYSVSGNVVRVRILICATRQKPCRKRVYPDDLCQTANSCSLQHVP